MLTQADINAIRKADYVGFLFDGDRREAVAVRRAPTDDPLAYDKRHALTATVCSHKPAEQSGRCWATVDFYGSFDSPLHTLKVGDEITFEFSPDGASNDYVAWAGLHADTLTMFVRRGKRTTRHLIKNSICPENTARMCRGAHVDDWYRKAAAEGRYGRAA